MTWETIIGLEVHVQLNTNSKIFSGSSAAFGGAPNTHICEIDIALPGVLPVLNEMAVQKAISLGLAIDAQIAPISQFARKNYFYPDLPKGYQISQYDLPVVHTGHLDILLDDDTTKRIRITRAHLEEDAGKSLHENFHGQSGIDLNRAGVPLLEIVSEPDLRSAREAVVYLKTLHNLVKYLNICDGNLQEGSFRCDANISVRKLGDTKLGTRAEIKNLNSFRFVERAIQVEVQRQIEILENGGTVSQETRLYDADLNETRTLRSKENAHDYRYFPDPDLLPLKISENLIEAIRITLPELPHQKRQRFIEKLGLAPDTATVLVAQKTLAEYFETALSIVPQAPQILANWITGDLLGALNKSDSSIESCPVSPQNLGTLVLRIVDQTISSKMAKDIFEILWEGKQGTDEIIEKQGFKQVTDTGAIGAIVDQVIAQFPQQLADYRSGKDKLFGFFVGQVMKASQGKANPQQINDILLKKLQ